MISPIGMTIFLNPQAFHEKHLPRKRIVIPTGAKRSGGTCGFFPVLIHPSLPKRRNEIPSTLLSGDSHSVNPQSRRRNRTTKLQIVRNRGDVIQHFLQVAGDRNLLDRERQLAILDP
jgi:hypothetical protein